MYKGFALSAPIPYVQDAILNPLNPYLRSAIVLLDELCNDYSHLS